MQCVARRSSKGFAILRLKMLNLMFFAVYGIWDNLGAWKILLRDVSMIWLQFWDFPKMTQNREVSTLFSTAGFCPKRYQKKYLPAKALPS